jgi:hypothetical protein
VSAQTWDDLRATTAGEPRKLTYQQAEHLRAMRLVGWSYRRLATFFTISERTARHIVHDETYLTELRQHPATTTHGPRHRHLSTDTYRGTATRDDYCTICGDHQLNALCHIEGLPDRRAAFTTVD